MVLLAFVLLSVRLILIVRDNGEKYKKQVLSQQKYDSITIPFKRGDITDRNGVLLATSNKVYNIILDPKVILDKEDYLEPTLYAMSKYLGFNESEIRSVIADNPSSSYIILKKNVPYSELQNFVAYCDGSLEDPTESDNNAPDKVKGVWFEDKYIRYYPNGSLAADAIGFAGADNNGTGGLEEYYNETLNGTNGREYGYLNDDSNLERTTIAAKDGETLVSTIDANIQSICEKYILKFNQENANVYREGAGSNNTGVIIMEVKTGNVLAMASYPTFDLNNPRDLSAYYTEEELAKMEEENTLTQAYNTLWRNFCISDTYEPGSVAKPFTVAAGLESGAITGDEVYNCTGSLEIGGHKIKCHNRYGDGLVSVQRSVEISCNVGLMYIAQAIGIDRFTDYQRRFGFGLRTGVDLAGESRTDSLVYTADTMGPTELATCSFGQGFNVTMIQTITGFCSMLNGGYLYEPHMVSKILSSDGSVVETIQPRVLKQTVSQSTCDKIIQYCNGVVTDGTGKTARPAGYAIGGKTGTAETLPRGNKEYVVSFMGYAPADDPEIAIYCVVDRPNAQHQDDAKFATGIVHNILTEVLPYLHYPMTEELSEKEIAELEQLQIDLQTEYTQVVSENDPETVSGNEGAEDGSAGDGETTTTAEGADTASGDGTAAESSEPVWKSFEIDPETGYAIDPNTGDLVDPETGAVVGGSSFE
ncbi:MAG: cell division protein FtsI [Lachnospiraceae bacterium]|nr:cell division protein FtsI [Lachnospiraceae bacterium]